MPDMKIQVIGENNIDVPPEEEPFLYTIEYSIEFPYHLWDSDEELNKNLYDEMSDWCDENLSHLHCLSERESEGAIIIITNKEDAVAFKLRWM